VADGNRGKWRRCWRGAESWRPDRALGQLSEEYLTYKEQHGKRSLREDRRILKTRLLPTLGTDFPVRRLRGAAVAQYERQRAGPVSAFTLAN
jgi:hypothetical protein